MLDGFRLSESVGERTGNILVDDEGAQLSVAEEEDEEEEGKTPDIGGENAVAESDAQLLERFTGFAGESKRLESQEIALEDELANPRDSVGRESAKGGSGRDSHSATKTPEVLESVDTPQPESESMERREEELELGELMWKHEGSHALLAQEVKKAVQSDEAKALIAQQREEEERRRHEGGEEVAVQGLSRSRGVRELTPTESDAPGLSRNKSEKLLQEMSASESEKRGAWQASPYHSNSFFTGGFDERKMEDVLEELRSSQG